MGLNLWGTIDGGVGGAGSGGRGGGMCETAFPKSLFPPFFVGFILSSLEEEGDEV